jgi:D-psicose/D-tagatose/L-ribulose 3-epimerase
MRLAVSKTKEAGFDLLEIPLMDPYGFDVAATRKLLSEYDLAATASLGLNERTDISSEDPDIVAAGEQFLGKCLEVLSDVGGTALVGVIYCAMKKYSAPASPLARQNSVDAIARLAARCQELGIRLGIEVVNRYESNLVNTGRQGLAFVQDVGHDNVTVHLDTYHMNIEEDDLVKPVHEVADRLGYVHVGENHRGSLGSGHIDFTSFFQALADIGYRGPVTFESFSSSVLAPDLSYNLAIWRDLWTDGPALAAHAHEFVTTQLTIANV